MILGFIGRRGSGKTLSMIKQAYRDYLNGREIYSNISLGFPHKIITKEMLMSYVNGDSDLSNCTILLDELHMYMDSRLSPSKANLLISYFALQSRKRDVDIYFTTQSQDQIDKRMRKQMDILISCVSKKKPMLKDGVALFDKHGKPKEHVWIKLFIIDIESKSWNEDFFYANDYFSLYDTYEIVSL